MTEKYTGRVLPGGLLVLDRPRDYGQHVKSHAGQRVELTLRKERTRRSLDQNAWLWGVAYPILAAEFGYDRHELDALHYGLVAKCFGARRDDRLGIDVPNARSSKLTTAQFSDYMEWVIRFAAVEYGIRIPLPNEVDYSTLEAA
jgi:hypothetical protein